MKGGRLMDQLSAVERIDLGDGKVVIKVKGNGDCFYFWNGFLHRDDGPAVETSDNGKIWYNGGMRHREDGPAFIGSDGEQRWYISGLLHRLDGPAVVKPDGTEEWWKNGVIKLEW
jgi:hypothetical protein